MIGFSWLICSTFRFGVIWMFQIKVRLTQIVTLLNTTELLIRDIGLYVPSWTEVKWKRLSQLLFYVLNRLFTALANEIPITNPAYYGSRASDQELADIFKSDTKEEAPMLDERIRVMREAGKVLCEVNVKIMIIIVHAILMSIWKEIWWVIC